MKKIALLISMVSFISGCYGISSVQNLDNKDTEFTAKSLTSLEKEKITSEIENYKKRILTDKTDTEAYEKLSDLYFQLNDNERGTLYFAKGSQYSKSKPSSSTFDKKSLEANISYDKMSEKDFENLINVYYREKNHSKVIEITRQAIKYYPENPEFYNTLGVVLSVSGEKYEAIDIYKKAIELNPKEAVYHYDIASSYKGIGDIDMAINEYELAHKLEPNFLGIEAEIAKLYQMKNNNHKAIEVYKNTREYKLGIEPDFSEIKNKITSLEK